MSEVCHVLLDKVCWRGFSQNILKFKKNHFDLIILFFSCDYCSIDLKWQSKHSGLRPDLSSLVTNCHLLQIVACYELFPAGKQKLLSKEVKWSQKSIDISHSSIDV